jgi:hypothetical protein
MHTWTCTGCSQCRPAGRQQGQALAGGGSRGGANFLLNEAQELELALELLSVSNEAELEQFLGKMFKGIAKVGKGLLKPLGGALKSIAKTALPFVGGALGSFIPIPGVGTALGTALGSAVSKALEVEMEGLDREVAELEMAQRFVRLAADAANRVAAAVGDRPPSENLVRSALVAATRRHLPNLDLGGTAMSHQTGGPMGGGAGRWVRQGGQLSVLNT